MKYFIPRLFLIALMAIIALLLGMEQAKASERYDLIDMAHKNHLYVSSIALNAFIKASKTYHIPAKELFTISVIESNLNPNAFRLNHNGSTDTGLMQVNSINKDKCLEYDINTILGNVLCGAKILANLKVHYPSEYLGIYHSKTPKFKKQYIAKVSEILYNTN